MTHSPLKATVHTPGPWEVKGNILKCTGPYGKYLFKLEEMPGTGSEAEPNARLIAAAPDMLAVLKLGQVMRDRQRAYFKERSQGALIVSKQAEAEFDRAVIAAIRKAEGREP
jgi:hypothetical protein